MSRVREEKSLQPSKTESNKDDDAETKAAESEEDGDKGEPLSIASGAAELSEVQESVTVGVIAGQEGTLCSSKISGKLTNPQVSDIRGRKKKVRSTSRQYVRLI